MTETIETPEAVEDQTLVALTPADMVPAQAELSTWCDRKLAALGAELRDMETNLELATEHGWKYPSVAGGMNRLKKRVTFYEKLKTAVDAGYVVVPNFPIDLFAVRVKRRKQHEQTSSYGGTFRATPELLPAGEGRYVDDLLYSTKESYADTDREGKPITRTRYTSGEYDDVDFPVVVVKPAILNATKRAMALKLFDQMGVVQNMTGRDPIIVGQLLDPRGNGRRVTFFVAWWLNTADL